MHFIHSKIFQFQVQFISKNTQHEKKKFLQTAHIFASQEEICI